MREVIKDRETGGNLEGFIHQLRQKGVMLWMEKGGLRYRAPKGVLTSGELQALSVANGQIASILGCNAHSPDQAIAAARSVDVFRAPLSFTQLEHWHGRRRYGGRPIRHIASAFRLQGPLRIGSLKESIQAVGRRHHALCTRIVLAEHIHPVQEVADRYCPVLEVIQLGSVPEDERQTEVERQIRRAILDADNYAESPLFKPVLLVIAECEHVLILAMDHMIADLASLYLVSEEIFTAYSQLLSGNPIDLPPVAVQFTDHATRLRARSPGLLMKARKRLHSVGRTRFPEDVTMSAPTHRTDLESFRCVFNKDLCDELRTWARRHGTTLAMATLTAYAAVVLRWCGVTETVISFMTNGRSCAELERTIGYLAFAIYIRVAIENASSFVDLLRSVTEEYCRGGDEADFGCAIAQEERPEFTRSTAVNWLPTGCAITGTLSRNATPLSWSSVDFSNPVLETVTEFDQEPLISFTEGEGILVAEMTYARQRFSERRIARLMMNFRRVVETMVRTPTKRVAEIEMK